MSDGSIASRNDERPLGSTCVCYTRLNMEGDNVMPESGSVPPIPSASIPPVVPVSQPPIDNATGTTVNYPGKRGGVVGFVLAFVMPPVGLIVSIVAANKSKQAGYKNILAKTGIILSAVFLFIYIAAMIVFSIGAIKFINSNEGRSVLVQMNNDLSKEFTDEADVAKRDYLSGYNWKVGDGSVILFSNDGKFKWRQTEDLKSAYYEGTFQVYSGEDAMRRINENYVYNFDNYFSRATGALRQDVTYLRLTNTGLFVDGKNTMNGTTQSDYLLFFGIDNKDSASGLRLRKDYDLVTINITKYFGQ